MVIFVTEMPAIVTAQKINIKFSTYCTKKLIHLNEFSAVIEELVNLIRESIHSQLLTANCQVIQHKNLGQIKITCYRSYENEQPSSTSFKPMKGFFFNILNIKRHYKMNGNTCQSEEFEKVYNQIKPYLNFPEKSIREI